jgi:hypothetical protein
MTANHDASGESPRAPLGVARFLTSSDFVV